MKDQYLLNISKSTSSIFSYKLVVQESFIDGNLSGMIATKNLIVFTNVINSL